MSSKITYDVAIGKGSAQRNAQLAIEDNTFRYAPDHERKIEQARPQEYSMVAAGPRAFSVLTGGRSYAVTLLGDGTVSVNGTVVQLEVFDPRALRSRRTGADAQGRQTVTAPMPGRVIRVLVEVGQDVESGQGLLVVEAMKMQNEMKSPKAGKVLQVKTAPGAAVGAGDVLLVIE